MHSDENERERDERTDKQPSSSEDKHARARAAELCVTRTGGDSKRDWCYAHARSLIACEEAFSEAARIRSQFTAAELRELDDDRRAAEAASPDNVPNLAGGSPRYAPASERPAADLPSYDPLYSGEHRDPIRDLGNLHAWDFRSVTDVHWRLRMPAAAADRIRELEERYSTPEQMDLPVYAAAANTLRRVIAIGLSTIDLHERRTEADRRAARKAAQESARFACPRCSGPSSMPPPVLCAHCSSANGGPFYRPAGAPVSPAAAAAAGDAGLASAKSASGESTPGRSAASTQFDPSVSPWEGKMASAARTLSEYAREIAAREGYPSPKVWVWNWAGSSCGGSRYARYGDLHLPAPAPAPELEERPNLLPAYVALGTLALGTLAGLLIRALSARSRPQ